MTSPPDDPPSLVSEDDRDAAVKRLQEAYAEGHISHEEMDERLQRALTARTNGELGQALISLPEKDAGTTSTISVMAGRIRRRGAWRVPRKLTIESAFGKVDLDLSRAVIEHSVDIELRLGTGGAKITVPRDAVVDLDGLRTAWRDALYTPPRRPRPGGPTIRISGSAGFGRVKIRHARR